jgi:RNase H-like domain found in reverse transcriptase
MVMDTDASVYALGTTLSLFDDEDILHPVTFHSRTFTGAKLNYNVHDKELLAIFEAFQCWQHYLEGSSSLIDVITDHKNLEYFATTKLLNPMTSPLVRIPLAIQPHYSVLSQKARYETRHFN